MSRNQNRPDAKSHEGGFLYSRLKSVAEFVGGTVLLFAAGAASFAALSETLVSFDEATMHPLDTDI